MTDTNTTGEPHEPVQEPQDAAQEPQEHDGNHEAAKYRRRLRETEALAEAQLAEAMAARDAVAAELAEYKAREKQAEVDAMRAEVAKKHTMPVEIIAGDTLEEMEAWAQKLNHYLPHPGYVATAGQRPDNGGSSWSAAFKASEE